MECTAAWRTYPYFHQAPGIHHRQRHFHRPPARPRRPSSNHFHRTAVTVIAIFHHHAAALSSSSRAPAKNILNNFILLCIYLFYYPVFILDLDEFIMNFSLSFIITFSRFFLIIEMEFSSMFVESRVRIWILTITFLFFLRDCFCRLLFMSETRNTSLPHLSRLMEWDGWMDG